MSRKRYADGTTVSVEQSQAEIVSLLRANGVNRHAVIQDVAHSALEFEMQGRWYRLQVTLPPLHDKAFTRTPSGAMRGTEEQRKAWEREIMRRWRCLVLLVRAKLAALEERVVSVNEEWMPYLILPDGSTMAEKVEPQIEKMYASGAVPDVLGKFLPAPASEEDAS